jgi:hypothetical protein
LIHCAKIDYHVIESRGREEEDVGMTNGPPGRTDRQTFSQRGRRKHIYEKLLHFQHHQLQGGAKVREGADLADCEQKVV